MTAAVAGTAGRAVAGRAAAGSAGSGAAGTAAAGGGRAASGTARPARKATRGGNRPRPDADEREAAAAQRTRERGDRAAGEFRKRYQMDGGRRAEKKPATTTDDDTDTDTDTGGESGDSSGDSSSEPTRPQRVWVPQPVSSGAGFILAILAWGWIVLPYLKDGPAGVRNVLMAKFLNKAPDGSPLP